MSVQIVPCGGCGRLTRPSNATIADHPGTIVRGGRDTCITCYKAKHPSDRLVLSNGPMVRAMSREVVFATVPDARDPQRSDCRLSCCKNPFKCAQNYRCGCHWRSQ